MGKNIHSEYIKWQSVCGGCETLHDRFFDSSSDAVIILDSDLKIIQLNNKVESLFEYSPKEMLGKTPMDFLTPRSYIYFQKRYATLQKDQYTCEREINIKYGRTVEVLSTESPIIIENEFKGMIIFVRDITERKASEEMLNLESSALEATAMGIAITNERGDIVWINSAFKTLTGYDDDELLYKNMRILNSGKQAEYFYADLWNTIKSGKVWQGELINKRRDGKLYSEEQTITPVKGKGNTITNYIVTKTNISKRKQMEETLRQMNEDLEELVKERTEQLAESEKMAALGELVAGVAHEINNPVGISYTAATYIEDQTKMLLELYQNNQLKESEFNKYLKEISQLSSSLVVNLNKAADLIRSFKQIAVDQSYEEIREFEVKNYFNEVITSLKPQISKQNHEINLSCQNNLKISGYPGAYSQILTNLIINSLVHGFEDTENGKISIDVSALDEHFLISYSDNGKGIPKKNLKKIFDPFFSTKFGKGGSGLGLNIIYNLVTRKLNGEISCQSEKDKGVHFVIKVPIQS